MGPLAGLKVIEVTGFGPGPMAGMLLADQGADVVRVERPGESWFKVEPRFFLHNRGKRRIALDLKNAEALELLMQLIDGADILLEGFRPGVAERIGFGPEACHERNPGLIYARITGYGQTGPFARLAGHDINYVATAGVLAGIGPADGPPVVPLNLVGDFGGGAMFTLFGVLSALYERQTSGRGQVVDVAMAEAAMALQTNIFGYTAAGIHRPQRGANQLDGGAPFYAVYQAADGEYVAIGALEKEFFADLADKLDLDRGWIEWRHDRDRWPELRALLAAKFSERTRDEWQVLLETGNSCFSPVLSVAEAANYPQFVERGSVVSVDGVAQPGIVPRFDRSDAGAVHSVPAPGSTSDSILSELGVDADRIARLRAAGAVQ